MQDFRTTPHNGWRLGDGGAADRVRCSRGLGSVTTLLP
jgi:hypothetical protein